MNDVQRAPSVDVNTLPDALGLMLPAELARAVGMLDGDWRDHYLPRPGDPVIAMARVALDGVGSMMQTTPPAVIGEWLNRLALAVANPPGPAEMRPRRSAIIMASGDLPRMCWTVETWKAYLRSGPSARFWPAVADVDGFLRPIAEQHAAKLDALRRIAAVGSAPAPAPPVEPISEAAAMTLAERDAAINAIRGKHGYRRHDYPPDEDDSPTPPAVRSVPVSDEALRLIRERRRADMGLPPLAAAKPKGGEP